MGLLRYLGFYTWLGAGYKIAWNLIQKNDWGGWVNSCHFLEKKLLLLEEASNDL